MDEKILYLDCASGISGDMTVGALLDLGASREKLVRALDSLGVSGYHLHFGRTKKCGIDAYDFDVHLEEEEHHHDHDRCAPLSSREDDTATGSKGDPDPLRGSKGKNLQARRRGYVLSGV